ncbi:MAG: FmdB family zinc ribbon protein [Actinomycetota bacterium]
MPTYEYACTECGQHIEVFQRLAEESLSICGACGGRLRKVFHPAGILFKGSGFYSTDSRAKKSKAGASESSSSESKSESKGAESKSEGIKDGAAKEKSA